MTSYRPRIFFFFSLLEYDRRKKVKRFILTAFPLRRRWSVFVAPCLRIAQRRCAEAALTLNAPLWSLPKRKRVEVHARHSWWGASVRVCIYVCRSAVRCAVERGQRRNTDQSVPQTLPYEGSVSSTRPPLLFSTLILEMHKKLTQRQRVIYKWLFQKISQQRVRGKKNIISATITKDSGIKGAQKARSVTHYKNCIGLRFVRTHCLWNWNARSFINV